MNGPTPSNANYAMYSEMVSSHKLGLVRRFDFTSKLMRASVIVKNFSNGRYKSFVKGSPEKIRELSIPKTVPDNFDEI